MKQFVLQAVCNINSTSIILNPLYTFMLMIEWRESCRPYDVPLHLSDDNCNGNRYIDSEKKYIEIYNIKVCKGAFFPY